MYKLSKNLYIYITHYASEDLRVDVETFNLFLNTIVGDYPIRNSVLIRAARFESLWID